MNDRFFQGLVNDRYLRGLKWFAVGFALGTVLSIGFGVAHYVPASVALGVLCFTCGVLAMESLTLWKSEKKASEYEDRWFERLNEVAEEKKQWETEKETVIAKAEEDAESHWLDAFNELEDQKAQLEKDKKEWELKKQEWEAGKQANEATREIDKP